MSPRVLRRFPSLRKEGLVAGGIFSRKQKNPMTELLDFIQRNPHSHLLKDVKLKPAHWWKPAVPALGDLPAQMVKLLNPERGYTAKLIRSPERVMGVGDILGRSAKVRSFSFSDLLCRGYTHDFRVIVCLTLVFGFWIWYNNIPEPMFTQPSLCYSSEWARLVKEALSSDWTGCPLRKWAWASHVSTRVAFMIVSWNILSSQRYSILWESVQAIEQLHLQLVWAQLSSHWCLRNQSLRRASSSFKIGKQILFLYIFPIYRLQVGKFSFWL